MTLAQQIDELPDTDNVHCYDYEIRTDDLKRLVALLRKCESTAKLLSETLPPKQGGTIASELLGEIREVLG